MCSLIQSGVDEGAKLLLDGRDVNVKGYESGYFVGPTIIGGVTVREFEVSVTCPSCAEPAEAAFTLPAKIRFLAHPD